MNGGGSWVARNIPLAEFQVRSVWPTPMTSLGMYYKMQLYELRTRIVCNSLQLYEACSCINYSCAVIEQDTLQPNYHIWERGLSRNRILARKGHAGPRCCTVHQLPSLSHTRIGGRKQDSPTCWVAETVAIGRRRHSPAETEEQRPERGILTKVAGLIPRRTWTLRLRIWRFRFRCKRKRAIYIP